MPVPCLAVSGISCTRWLSGTQITSMCSKYTMKTGFCPFRGIKNQIFTIKRQKSINAAQRRRLTFKNLKLYSYAKQTLKKNFSYLSGSCNVNNGAILAAENCYGEGC